MVYQIFQLFLFSYSKSEGCLVKLLIVNFLLGFIRAFIKALILDCFEDRFRRDFLAIIFSLFPKYLFVEPNWAFLDQELSFLVDWHCFKEPYSILLKTHSKEGLTPKATACSIIILLTPPVIGLSWKVYQSLRQECVSCLPVFPFHSLGCRLFICVQTKPFQICFSHLQVGF